MAILKTGLAIPDLLVPRGNPCGAISGMNVVCGATPSVEYMKMCGVTEHATSVFLCPIHAAIVACGGAMCRMCAERGGIVAVRIYRLSYEPLRIHGNGGVIRAG